MGNKIRIADDWLAFFIGLFIVLLGILDLVPVFPW